MHKEFEELKSFQHSSNLSEKNVFREKNEFRIFCCQKRQIIPTLIFRGKKNLKIAFYVRR
jgi:hypothetical protein